jgi:hypothetical protein
MCERVEETGQNSQVSLKKPNELSYESFLTLIMCIVPTFYLVLLYMIDPICMHLPVQIVRLTTFGRVPTQNQTQSDPFISLSIIVFPKNSRLLYSTVPYNDGSPY